ncbi:AAA family ATPase [Pseudomonas batumici]|uniref:NERD domain-containing protein n=1 Tax=Pseudomonas batumici TaxID=226910 RepID=A0A0C2I4E4_9PSED|nr:AAA family ATPase [Pseudomonas batumici]KIH84086.1 hypothetical protein UCMB321_2086 [Pseudomonas batumici]
MARMIPSHGPRETESFGESSIYWILKKNLSDDFTVIHSLPWISSEVKKIDPKAAPTGEIDFLVIHPMLGLLTLEIKSGRYRIDHSTFVHIKSNEFIDPVQQARRNAHGLSKCLGVKPSLRLRIGYAFVFPDSHFGEAMINTAMVDCSIDPPQRIFIDRGQMPTLADRIKEIMCYWKIALNTPDLSPQKTKELMETLCHNYDGTPNWAQRVIHDNKLWLRLTEEQNQVVQTVCNRERMLVTGWPGTGKTLIGIEVARKLLLEGKRILFVTFNTQLATHIKSQLPKTKRCNVSTWHGLCSAAQTKLNTSNNASQNWLKTDCNTDLQNAISQGLMESYDILILDEAQALDIEWCKTLINWFESKPIACFCDETQVFSFEPRTTKLNELQALLGVISPFLLTIALRMPKAVTEHLINVMPPNHQLTSPREFEKDTITEIITETPLNKLFEIHAHLLEQGFDKHEIRVLLSSLQSYDLRRLLDSKGIRHENIAKFRGLEAPAVIIYGADHMTDSELFCAYSRATSLCISLFSLEPLIWKENSAFQKSVRSQKENKPIIELAQFNSLTTNIIPASTPTYSLNLLSIDLSWAPGWGAWMIEFDPENELAETWIDYLTLEHEWPVLFWYKDSRKRLYLSEPDNEQGPLSFTLALDLKYCYSCCTTTPFKGNIDAACIICTPPKKPHQNSPDEIILETISIYDGILSSTLSDSKKPSRSLEDLPFPLAAAGARLYASQHKKRNKILDMPLPSGKIIYRAALAFVQSRIATYEANRSLITSEVALQLYNRFKSLQTLDLKNWTSIVANALGTCKQKNFIKKITKGEYRIVEDADIPEKTVEPPF